MCVDIFCNLWDHMLPLCGNIYNGFIKLLLHTSLNPIFMTKNSPKCVGP